MNILNETKGLEIAGSSKGEFDSKFGMDQLFFFDIAVCPI